ncbi:hypothetical protein ACI48D_01320 [Massilia sp. LXY-6]|uniref:hypothetical protein n=1 Tax=Massilia sp. LXY-6 TaxID=3379823 RepID=UPI003EE15D91
MKSAVIRQVKSMAMSCDRVGNLLLAKFSTHGANDTCVIIPASIVFFLLKNLPANQDPTLQAPPAPPQITQWDWDNPNQPRAFTVNCKVLPGKISMSFNLDVKPDLTLVLDRSNVELMRQILHAYSQDLIDLE